MGAREGPPLEARSPTNSSSKPQRQPQPQQQTLAIDQAQRVTFLALPRCAPSPPLCQIYRSAQASVAAQISIHHSTIQTPSQTSLAHIPNGAHHQSSLSIERFLAKLEHRILGRWQFSRIHHRFFLSCTLWKGNGCSLVSRFSGLR
jgi:hypothetical protein